MMIKYGNSTFAAHYRQVKRKLVAGVVVVLVSPQNYVLLRAFLLTEPCSNNVAEYNTLLIGMKISCEIGIQNLEGYNNSLHIVNQVCGEYEVHHKDLVFYHTTAIQMAEEFKSFYIEQIPHRRNAYTYALDSLATSLTLQAGTSEAVLVFTQDLYCPKSAIGNAPSITEGLQDKGKEVLKTYASLNEGGGNHLNEGLLILL